MSTLDIAKEEESKERCTNVGVFFLCVAGIALTNGIGIILLKATQWDSFSLSESPGILYMLLASISAGIIGIGCLLLAQLRKKKGQ